MKWVTRERPKIDRIACPWLVTRFIDETPQLLYMPGEDVMRVAEQTGAIPYDVQGVGLSHGDELCSFDALLAKYKLDDPALAQLPIEHGSPVSLPESVQSAAPRATVRRLL